MAHLTLLGLARLTYWFRSTARVCHARKVGPNETSSLGRRKETRGLGDDARRSKCSASAHA